tara:strand:- start:184 stop:567 length:384 start_codon:yes stop_codon:yes gene_type:complete
MKTKGFILTTLVIIIAYGSYNYMYQDHRNVFNEEASISITSTELYNKFKVTPSIGNKDFINEIIEFRGTVKLINNDLILIEPSIACKLDSNFSSTNLNIGDTLLLKGRCIGFDDLFMEVKMDNVSFN